MVLLLAFLLFGTMGVIAACYDSARVFLVCTIVVIGSLFTTCTVNENEREISTETIEYYSTFNDSVVQGRGGLFHTTIDERDYLVYWVNHGEYKTREKIKIDWDIVRVLEDDGEIPRIEVDTRRRIESRKNLLFDLGRDSKDVQIRIFVPEGTVISYSRLE